MTPTFPPPNPDQQALSEKLISKIIAEIKSHGGAIPFSHYMEMVLYEPGLGYYTAGQQKLGADGDFITAPELSPLFGYCVANACVDYFREHPTDNILEFGAGSGKLAVDIIHQLKIKNALPAKYFILEVSPDLQERQKFLCQKKCGDYFENIIWLMELPKNFQGIMIANEVLDAMPVEKFKIHNGTVMRMGVAYKNNRFEWVMMEPLRHCEAEGRGNPNLKIPGSLALVMDPGSRDFQSLSGMTSLPRDDEGYESEISTIIPAWLTSITTAYSKNPGSPNLIMDPGSRDLQSLSGMTPPLRDDGRARGKIILIDYGFLEHEFYHPQRSQGTLMCHYRHHAHPDPFVYPGLQDITAHVNFSQIGHVAESLGWKVHFETQAEFLLRHGLLAFPTNDLSTSNTIKKLTLLHEMGELFKVMILSKFT